jgi:hypothetical protein
MPIATLIGFGWKGAFADAGVTIVQKVWAWLRNV